MPEEKKGETGSESKDKGEAGGTIKVLHEHRVVKDKPEKPSKPEKPAGEGAGETGSGGDKPPENGGEPSEAEKAAAAKVKDYEAEIEKLKGQIGEYTKKEEEADKVKALEEQVAGLEKSKQEYEGVQAQLKKTREELEATRGKLETRESQLGQIAMKAFEDEKTNLTEIVKKQLGEEEAQEIVNKITNPKQLEEAKSWMAVFAKVQEEKKPPKEGGEEGEEKKPEPPTVLSKTGGQIPLKPPGKGQIFERAKDVVNALYDAYEEELFKMETGKEFDRARLMEAQTKLNKLWVALMEGVRKRGGKVIEGTFDIRSCPFCKATYLGDKAECPSCGHTIPAHERGKTRRG